MPNRTSWSLATLAAPPSAARGAAALTGVGQECLEIDPLKDGLGDRALGVEEDQGADQILRQGELTPGEGLGESADPLASRADLHAGGDEGDAAMAELDQVIHRLKHAFRMIGQHRIELEVDLAVEQHRGHAGRRQ